MSWLDKLYQTYQQCGGSDIANDPAAMLEPICHTSQQAQIEITLDEQGRFRAATAIKKGHGVTLVPCTEASSGRSGAKPVNHPLCDKLQYLAGDFLTFGGVVTSGFAADPGEPHRLYLSLLQRWAASPFTHPKVQSILAYVQQGRMVADLLAAQVLPGALEEGKTVLLKTWQGDKNSQPGIFASMAAGSAPEDALVRWRVEIPDQPVAECWKDKSLMEAWIGFYCSESESPGLCLVTGETTALARQHGAKLRHAADKAKLISSNDSTGYTYRGRFSSAEQACAVGFDVSQKAHSALRWLIRRQAFRNGDQVVLAWHVAGKEIPNPTWDSWALFGEEDASEADSAASESDSVASGTAAVADTTVQPAHMVGDVGQGFSRKLAQRLRGYGSQPGSRNEIVIMALDSATTGRLAITYYREFDFPEYIARLENWHTRHAWWQNYGKDKRFIGAPAPEDIVEACYGGRADDKLTKATVERLLPCIMEGGKVPLDLMQMAVRRASNRIGLKFYDWEKCLGIACGLFRGYCHDENNEEGNYQMTLETQRATPAYLFGRLLAIADNIEQFALDKANQTRETEAARAMQRFMMKPSETWANIAKKLQPYKIQLRAVAPGFLNSREKQLDEVMNLFDIDEFNSARNLSGEFLLGFHCQRHELRKKSGAAANPAQANAQESESESESVTEQP
jgi:CRISPR-associated protein Csd1